MCSIMYRGREKARPKPSHGPTGGTGSAAVNPAKGESGAEPAEPNRVPAQQPSACPGLRWFIDKLPVGRVQGRVQGRAGECLKMFLSDTWASWRSSHDAGLGNRSPSPEPLRSPRGAGCLRRVVQTTRQAIMKKKEETAPCKNEAAFVKGTACLTLCFRGAGQGYSSATVRISDTRGNGRRRWNCWNGAGTAERD